MASLAAIAWISACAASGDPTNSGAAGSSGGSGGASSGSGGSGGASSGAGSSAAGNSGTCDPRDDGACIAEGKAVGKMTGFGFVALGALDSVSSPTCDNSKNGGSANDAITKASPCAGTVQWTAKDSLCITGSIPPLPASAKQEDYDNNWGIQVGFTSSDPVGKPLGDVASSYKTITFTVKGSPQSGLRAEIHRLNDPDDVTYCANMISGKSIELSSFSTQCYGGSNDVKLKPEDLPRIDKLGVQVSSTTTAIKVENLCLTDVSFGK